MKGLVLFGSTGSIGRSTLEVISHFKERYRLIGLSAKSNLELLRAQAEAYQVPFLWVETEALARKLKNSLSYKAEVLFGDEGLKALAELEEAETLLIAIAGIKALIPAYYGLKKGKRVALANKECLVSAGSLLKETERAFGGEIIPVDSEHSALFQLLRCDKRAHVKKLILTASGGPFFHLKKEELERITPEEALKHPTWQMGAKITIDSATLMNKGFEVIEAAVLFDFRPSSIEVIIHPQSIIHSLVELVDGAMLAHLSKPDMKLAIAYALSYPDRWELPFHPLNLKELRELTFYEVDFEKFPCLKLAYEAAELGPPYPLILEAADEVLVPAFLKRYLKFTEIPFFLEKILKEFKFTERNLKELEDYLTFHQEVVNFTKEIVEKEKGCSLPL